MNERSPRNIISYFEHEMNPSFNFEKDVQEMREGGFNNIVLCLSEGSIQNSNRLLQLGKSVDQAHNQEFMILADPWGVGKVFGGEAPSEFAKTKKTACFCNEEFDQLMTTWLKNAQYLDVDGIFWDEPQPTCPHTSLDFLDHYTQRAKELGFYNSVCLTADPNNVSLLPTVANLSSVDDIATDPYWPNAFEKIPQNERTRYVASWTKFTKNAAISAGKDSHLWIQGFGINEGDTDMIFELGNAIQQNGVEDIAFWGFKGCQSLFAKEIGKANPDEIWNTAKTFFLTRNAPNHSAK